MGWLGDRVEFDRVLKLRVRLEFALSEAMRARAERQAFAEIERNDEQRARMARKADRRAARNTRQRERREFFTRLPSNLWAACVQFDAWLGDLIKQVPWLGEAFAAIKEEQRRASIVRAPETPEQLLARAKARLWSEQESRARHYIAWVNLSEELHRAHAYFDRWHHVLRDPYQRYHDPAGMSGELDDLRIRISVLRDRAANEYDWYVSAERYCANLSAELEEFEAKLASGTSGEGALG